MQKLSNSGGTSVASRVRSLFSSSPISRRKRAMSLDALSSVTNTGEMTDEIMPYLGHINQMPRFS